MKGEAAGKPDGERQAVGTNANMMNINPKKR